MQGLMRDNPPLIPSQEVIPSQQAGSKDAPARRAEIWAIGGGKGGIGKSFVSSSLGILLAARNRRVTMVDADLGGANLHTVLGIAPPALTLADFLERRTEDLASLVVETGVPNLRLISGAGDPLESANPKYKQRLRLMARLRALSDEFLLLDLGAGTSFNTLDFFNMAHKGLVVILPEPTSVENGYRFLRAAMLRRLRQVSGHMAFQRLLDDAQNPQNDQSLRHVRNIAERAWDISPVIGEQVLRVAERFSPRLILNQVRGEEDLRVGHGLRNACRNMLGINLRFQGAIPHDDTVWKSIRRRRPHVLESPESAAAVALDGIIERLCDEKQLTMNF
jgi:flagellar biosynthesis protein FlhG